MGSYRTKAFVLKKLNLGEADRVLTIFSKDFGKRKVLAKGIRRISSRRGGTLELFNQVVVFLREGKTFDLVTEAELINSYGRLRRSLPSISIAFVAAELIDKLLPENQNHEDVFVLLDSFFLFLSRAQRELKNSLLYSFEIKLLKALGFWNLASLSRIPRSLADSLKVLEKASFKDSYLLLTIPKERSVEIEKFLKYYIESVAESNLKSEDFRKLVANG